MAETEFNLSGLSDRINKIKQEGEESSMFTLEFLNCLLARHDLESALPDDFQIEDIPQTIIESLQQGKVPSKEEIILIDSDLQNSLICELVWLCGMYAVSCYTSDVTPAEGEPTYFESVLSMLEVSAGHFIGCYIIAAFSLLMSKVPSIDLVEAITNNFDDSDEQIQKSQEFFVELAAGILLRWKEDQLYTTPIE